MMRTDGMDDVGRMHGMTAASHSPPLAAHLGLHEQGQYARMSKHESGKFP